MRGLIQVTNGVVRDWGKLHELDFPVFCTGLGCAFHESWILDPSKPVPSEHRKHRIRFQLIVQSASPTISNCL